MEIPNDDDYLISSRINGSNTELQKDQLCGARFTFPADNTYGPMSMHTNGHSPYPGSQYFAAFPKTKAKLFAALVECSVIILHLATFILSRVIYNYVLDENGKAQFDFWADYFHSFPACLFITFFVGPFWVQFTAKRNEAPNILPGTSRLLVLFENALKRNVPDRHEKLIKFSRYTLLTWLLTMREFSKLLHQQFSNYMLIQKVLNLTDVERYALEENEKVNQPMGRPVHGWLRAMVKEMEFSGYFNPGDAKTLNDAVYNLKRNCDGVLKFSTRKSVTVRFTWVSFVALHAFGWLSVFGIKKGMAYLLSPYAIAYYCMYLANDIHRVNAYSFDDFGYDMIEIFQKKMYDCSVFLNTYYLTSDDIVIYDSKKTSLEFS